MGVGEGEWMGEGVGGSVRVVEGMDTPSSILKMLKTNILF
jgi:hypothetical protein